MEDNVTPKANGLWVTLVINKSLVAQELILSMKVTYQ